MLGLEFVCAAKVTLRTCGIIERNIHEVAQVVMVPRGLRRERGRFSIRAHRDSVVAEEGVAQAHERVNHIVFRTERKHATKVERRLPRVVFEEKLGEVTMSEERGITALLRCRCKLCQQALCTLRRCFERFLRALPKLFDRACPLTHSYSYSPSLF